MSLEDGDHFLGVGAEGLDAAELLAFQVKRGEFSVFKTSSRGALNGHPEATRRLPSVIHSPIIDHLEWICAST